QLENTNYTFSTSTNRVTLLAASSSTVSVAYSGFAPKLYFGDEPVQNGDPVVDANNQLKYYTDPVSGTRTLMTYTNSTTAGGLGTTKLYYRDSKNQPILHNRREPDYNTDETRRFHTSGDLLRYYGDERKVFFG